MSDLEIRGSGPIAVDTASLDAAAGGFELVAAALDDDADALAAVATDLSGVVFAEPETGDARALSREVAASADEARALAARLRHASAVYEIVELRAQLVAAEAGGDGAQIMRVRVALLLARATDPEAARAADLALRAWRADMGTAFGGQLLALGMQAGPLTLGALSVGLPVFRQAVRAHGGGTVDVGERLTGHPPPVAAVPLRQSARGAAPASLAEAAARMPGEGDARVRVEKYTMPDGTRQFAVYIAGTQTAASGGEDPFDMQSNLELYGGETAASYAVVVDALRAAGAGEGDAVHAFGHSQGGMIASRLATEGGFDTRTVVTFGSPVAADVGAGTLSVSVRHADDPVAALADGGLPAVVGAPGSFVAERVAHPRAHVGDLTLPSHHMTAYAETSAMLDASTDPRVQPLRDVLGELGAAASVETTVWAAARRDERLSRGDGAAGAG
ncbi:MULTISPECIES: hypothetical protein [unclassified Microbacterium]|uniref:hypothetical protein n=1 Tax=unclassified Microbacterium TaxID=2609290 RepID=UPI00214BA520|nr:MULTISPECIES: hypothetical protein [unclassified Microbacterium]MCR2800446.1 hypothetical protein [Microbacterium sp. zg.Y818]MCR2826333.1 hypothetical protein [Microbacterium sp. zg.Y909]WIM22404.1 hypothetical protein QNO21_15055 [Microbacterium sp. zg-Y818]